MDGLYAGCNAQSSRESGRQQKSAWRPYMLRC